MRVTIPYGSRPGEKIIGEGFFICPVCRYKRPYIKKKVVKVNYFGVISVASSKALMEYIHCGGCLNIFPVETIEPENQLKIEILEQSLPPNSLFDDWQGVFKELQCEALLTNRPDVREINSILMNNSADQMQKAGVSIKLKMFDETKVHMYNILSLSDEFFESKMKYKLGPSLADARFKQFSAAAHYILSKLP